MTKFQALFVLWLRHNSFQDCSWRELSGHYYNRYKSDGTLLPFNERMNFKETPLSGNQLSGIELERKAFWTLVKGDMLMGTPIDLYECDLYDIDANLKNHFPGINKYLSDELKSVKKIMKDRAIRAKIMNPDDLFDINKNPFDDWLDRENHEFDMGKYKTLIGIKNELKKQ